MALDPFDLSKVNEQHQISTERQITGTASDKFSNLPSSLIGLIFEFIPPEDLHKLRELNRILLINCICMGRSRLILSLKPNIKNGFEILEATTHSADLLNQLECPLKDLLSKESSQQSINANSNATSLKLSKATDLKQFLIDALVFYSETDLNAFCDLLNIIAKGRLFSLDQTLLESFGIFLDILLHYSCKKGLLCLGKTLLGSGHRFSPSELYIGLMTCVSNGHTVLFKSILKYAGRIEDKNLAEFLDEAVQKQNFEFVQLLFEHFPILSSIYSKCLYYCMDAKNLEIFAFIWQFRGDRDLRLSTHYNLNLLEYAAAINFPEAIEIFCSCETGLNILTKTAFALRIAILSGSTEALKTLVYFISMIAHLDLVYDELEISALLKTAVVCSDHFALKLILNNLFSDNLKNFDFYHIEHLRQCKNLIHFTIEKDDKESFLALLDKFNPSSLDIVDSFGRNAFLVAAFHGKYDYAVLIAALRPNSIYTCDIFFNNALHLLLIQNHPSEVIKSFSNTFELDWRAVNANGISPRDYVKKNRASNFG